MKIESVSHDLPPNMHGMACTMRPPFGPQEDSPIFLTIFVSERASSLVRGDKEKIFEQPREKVRLKTEGQVEKEVEIIRPMTGPIPPGMAVTRIPTVMILTREEYESLGRPTAGDRISIAIDIEKE